MLCQQDGRVGDSRTCSKKRRRSKQTRQCYPQMKIILRSFKISTIQRGLMHSTVNRKYNRIFINSRATFSPVPFSKSWPHGRIFTKATIRIMRSSDTVKAKKHPPPLPWEMKTIGQNLYWKLQQSPWSLHLPTSGMLGTLITFADIFFNKCICSMSP